ncbi:Cytochrome P450 [Corchorus capsularis]|uniref:Cytochrome P450 n=1 Tax=Corchorus capsularis TaxID=210143 RepID=A0A1R3FWR7_COCAP|nr:Cytochrome P450 [Corchorus capsularis]
MAAREASGLQIAAARPSISSSHSRVKVGAGVNSKCLPSTKLTSAHYMMIAGGTESSTVTLEWAISELLKKPEIFAKATAEVDRVIGRDRWVEEKDIANLPCIYTLHPVAPMLVPRLAREYSQVASYLKLFKECLNKIRFPICNSYFE